MSVSTASSVRVRRDGDTDASSEAALAPWSPQRLVAATPSLAIFGAVSRYDNAKDIEALVGASRNPASTLKVYPESWLGMVMTSFDHGVWMFDGNPDLRPSIVSWLRQQSP